MGPRSHKQDGSPKVPVFLILRRGLAQMLSEARNAFAESTSPNVPHLRQTRQRIDTLKQSLSLFPTTKTRTNVFIRGFCCQNSNRRLQTTEANSLPLLQFKSLKVPTDLELLLTEL